MLFDIHSHLIPGIDDGSETLDESLRILHAMESLGVNDVVLTPHYSVRRGYKLPKETVISSFDMLRDECVRDGIGINLYLGCEIEYSSVIPRMLRGGKLLTLGGTKYVLLEFAPYALFDDILGAVHRVIQVGYIPIIAHVERYRPFMEKIGNIEYIKHFGALVQVNVNSIISTNFSMKRFIKKILKKQVVDFIAGDVHSDLYTQLQLKRCTEVISKFSSGEYADKIMFGNARKIFTNEGE